MPQALSDFQTVSKHKYLAKVLDVQMIEVQKLVLVPILRAGEPMPWNFENITHTKKWF